MMRKQQRKQKGPPVSKTNGPFCDTNKKIIHARPHNRVAQHVGDATYGPRVYIIAESSRKQGS